MRQRASPEGRLNGELVIRAASKIQVVHIVPGSFGHNFSGITHRLFSLLSGWQDDDITLDLWGTDVQPVNMNSGDAEYRLRSGLWTGGRDLGLLRRIRESLRLLGFIVLNAGRFDIVHLHHLSWGALLSPIILHLMGRKAVYHLSLLGSDNPSALRLQRGGRLALALQRRFDGFVAVSPRLAADCEKHGFRNVLCLPNFLALRQVKSGRDAAAGEGMRSELSIPLDATVLLFVGGVCQRKGIDLLAESFVRMAQRHEDLWLLIVGPQSREESQGVDDEFVRATRESIGRAGVASRVRWMGIVNDKNLLARYYSAADIFVFPTRAEGFPNVLIEASAAGLPIVATDLKGITDASVGDGETGILVPCEHTDALTRATEQLITDKALRARMGLAARARSKQFGFEGYCRQLKAFYLKVGER